MEQVTIRFQYTEEEYVKAMRKYLLVTDTVKKFDLILAAVGLPSMLVYLFLSSFSVFSIILLVCAVVFAGFVGFQYFYVPVMVFRQTPKFKEEYRLTFTEAGVSFETVSVQSELKWDTYKIFWEGEECYYLVQEAQAFTLVPKRAFASEAEKLAFEQLAEKGTEYTKRKV